jgi:hypothetical protein
MKKKTVALYLGALAIIILVVIAGLTYLHFQQREYFCVAKGESFRYKDGVRLEEEIPGEIQFPLSIPAYGHSFELGKNNAFYAHRDSKIPYDPSRSSAVESTFLFDETNTNSKERIVTSVVFNLTSGAIRIFHHRWIPPNIWQNSDLYMYTGTCLPASLEKSKEVQEK